ncbi:MAG: hypothetical protein VB071_11130 [Lawsonibacter sp.]|nr:hypothetical protein [Lawsonibacter sp.]
MEQIFPVGKRFKALTALSVLLNIAVVCVFYLIYRYLLAASHPVFANTPLLLIFVGIAVLVVKATLSVSKRYAEKICCRIGKQELIVGNGATERRYPWKTFTSVQMDSTREYRLGTVVPVSFGVGEDLLTLNQHVGDLYGLTDEIIRHIEPYVSVDPELKKQIEAMKGTF